jgi:C4-dicarboxylate-specific signal transduction histidine kinase
MLASLLVTPSLLFFVGVELTLYSILISLAVPGIVSPIATIILLHVKHQLELAQRSKLEHLAKLASIGELASSIVHEINQPLAAIKLIAEGIRRKSNKDPQEVLKNLPEKIDRIVRQINRATEISAHIQQCIRMKRHNRRHV